MRVIFLVSLIPISLTVFSAPTFSASRQNADTATACTTLQNSDFSNIQDAPARIISAKEIPATPGSASLCVVEGYVTPQVSFELKLPLSNWNGKLVAVGNAGWGGRVNGWNCNRHVGRGYACVASDTGHKEAFDGSWAANNLAAQVDFGYRSVHVMTLAAKAIVSRYYSKDIERSYFVGCSTGGYEGLVEAQRFPWDFDGIIAGAPDMDEADLTMREVWESRSYVGSDGQPLLDDAHLKLLHEAVLAACDKDDGIDDGIVGNPLTCRFDPSKIRCKSGDTTGCLTATQVEAVERIYAGPPIPRVETLTRGALPGSELDWSMFGRGVPGEPLFRYMLYGANPEWTPTNYDFARDYKRLGMGALYTDTNPDLRRFKSTGGKLLVYQGWADIIEMPTAIVDYYEIVEKTMGGRTTTQNFFRLFMVPGMNHCGGGAGAFAIDYMSYLETWVEHGEAPDAMVGAHISDSYMNSLPKGSEWPLPDLSHGGVHNARVPISFTRPVYPYPLYAKYTGVGDPKDASNFRAATQSSGSAVDVSSVELNVR